MGDSVLILIAGTALGGILASGIWALAVGARRKRESVIGEKRAAIMQGIGELWAEIDSLVASNRAGILPGRQFRNSLASKLDAVNRMFKPSLHNLDLFYVKYAETINAGYSKLLRPGAPLTDEWDSDKEQAEEAPSVAAEDSDAATGLQSEDLAAFSEKEIGFDEEGPASQESVKQDAPAAAVEAEVAVEEHEVGLGDEPEPADETGQSKEAVAVEPAPSDEQSAQEEMEIVEDAPVAGTIEEVDEEPPRQAETAEAKTPIEEDFSMETIMDLDISKLRTGHATRISFDEEEHEAAPETAPAAQKPAEAKKPEPVIPSAPAPQPPKATPQSFSFDKAPSTELGGTLHETAFLKMEKVVERPEPEEEQVEQAPAKADTKSHDEEDVFAPPTLQEVEKHHAAPPAPAPHEGEESKDISITGDDIIDKMDAFFGIKR